MAITDTELEKQTRELIQTLALDMQAEEYIKVLVQRAFLKGWKHGIEETAETYREVLHGK